MKNSLKCIFVLLISVTVNAQSIFFQDFNDKNQLFNWTFSANSEYAYQLGVNKSNYVRFHPNFNNTTIQTPPISIAESGNYNISFSWSKLGVANEDSTQFSYSLNNGITWTLLKKINEGSNRIWTTDSSKIQLNTGIVIFRWKYFSTKFFPSTYFNLDNFSVTKEISTSTPEENIFFANIFPNPANHQLTVELEDYKDFNYKIISQQGHLILSGQLNATSTKIDISALPSSCYLFSLENDLAVYTKTFTIVR